jgi:hypothetical protein
MCFHCFRGGQPESLTQRQNRWAQAWRKRHRAYMRRAWRAWYYRHQAEEQQRSLNYHRENRDVYKLKRSAGQ